VGSRECVTRTEEAARPGRPGVDEDKRRENVNRGKRRTYTKERERHVEGQI
jgi:hypothetical protein